jgi:type II secretory pathway component PulK
MVVHRQSGVALLTVLLVVFLASVAAISLASVQQLAIRRSTLLLHQQQAHLYALGAEQWAAAILVRDLKDNQTDHLNETWATLPPALPVEGDVLEYEEQDRNTVEEDPEIQDHVSDVTDAKAMIKQGYDFELIADLIDGDKQVLKSDAKSP